MKLYLLGDKNECVDTAITGGIVIPSFPFMVTDSKGADVAGYTNKPKATDFAQKLANKYGSAFYVNDTRILP